MSNNGNGFDPMASWARLSERVENQGKDIVDLRSNMNTGFQTINSAIGTLSNELRNSSKTQWPVIWSAAGVCSAMLVAAGTFVYGTLSNRQDRIENSFVTFADRTISRQEMDWRHSRGAEDRQRMEKSIDAIRSDMVPRAELERGWDAINHRLDRLENARP
jgi:hypothetical protein